MLNLKDNPIAKRIIARKRELMELLDKNKITMKEHNIEVAGLDKELRKLVSSMEEPEKETKVIPAKKREVKVDDEWKPALPTKKKPKHRTNLERETVKDNNHPLLEAKETRKINAMRIFKGALFHGKKAQQGAFSGARVNPMLILGICLYITPLVLRVMGMGNWGWLQTVGFVVLIIGVILSFMEAIDE
jgi:hypothetical protein